MRLMKKLVLLLVFALPIKKIVAQKVNPTSKYIEVSISVEMPDEDRENFNVFKETKWITTARIDDGTQPSFVLKKEDGSQTWLSKMAVLNFLDKLGYELTPVNRVAGTFYYYILKKKQ